MNQEINNDEIRELEAALRRFGYGDTLDVIQKEEEVRRSDGIEKAIASLRKGNDNIKQQLETISQEDARRDFEAVNGRLIELANKRVAKSDETFEAAMAAVTLERPDLYEGMLKKRQVLILTKAAIEKEEKARAEAIEKQSATAKIKALAAQRQLRDGGTIEEAERVIRLENPGLVNDELME